MAEKRMPEPLSASLSTVHTFSRVDSPIPTPKQESQNSKSGKLQLHGLTIIPMLVGLGSVLLTQEWDAIATITLMGRNGHAVHSIFRLPEKECEFVSG